MRSVNIEPVLNGFIVRCGCQTVVFESREKLGSELMRYMADPTGMEIDYVKNALNPMQAAPAQPSTAWVSETRIIRPERMEQPTQESAGTDSETRPSP